MNELFIRDKTTGAVHRVGDNNHDCLHVEDGVVRYYNLQNGEGSGPNGDYEFVDSDLYGRVSEEVFAEAE